MNLKEAFGNKGLIKQHLSNYEYRSQQMDMAEAVASAFRDSRHLVVEAGTGVGKSFAYLIPAIDFAVNESERVVVSTNTISLQEQLINKDIPFLQEILPYQFKVVLVKGRSNYICLRRLENLMVYERGLFESKAEVDDLVRIHQWVGDTTGGSLSDLDPQPRSSVWNRVCCERDLCLGPVKCPFAKQCFYQKARSAMYNANLLIINHHMLFSDLSLRKNSPGFSVLPAYKYLIIDEAHNIENAATEHIGISLSKYGIRYLLDSLCNRDRKGGLFVRLGVPSMSEMVDSCRKQADSFFESVEAWASDNSSGTKRIRDKNFVANILDAPLNELETFLTGMKASAKSEEEEKEITAYAERCGTARSELDTILKLSLGNSVYWVEISQDKYINVTLNAAPINVSSELSPNLFGVMNSIVLTGATISTNQNFDYFKKRVGLDNCRELILGSPFDYSRQAKIYIPKNMPEPQKDEIFVPSVIEKAKQYLHLTHGKAFILFTSYKMMKEVYSEIGGWLAEQGIKSYIQGDGMSRHTMLEAFRTDIDSVLFGTSSFWEGVDVQGKALSNVIVVKLPFSVPTHPVVEARIDDIQARGGNPFIEYNLPEAIIKLKQGFGRLIRTKDDTGIVVILDPRVKTKFYGKMFLNSLPKCEIISQ